MMNSPSPQFMTPGRMGIYDPIHQMGIWSENFKATANPNAPPSIIVEMDPTPKLENQSEDTSQGTFGTPHYEHETHKSYDKIQRRLAQNREAARKSRLRKKAYVQQLEASRLKLMQMEEELERARQQGLYIGSGLEASQLGLCGFINPGITAFEMEYGQWVSEQNKQVCELRTALNAHLSDMELRTMVENVMNHYFELFKMKATAAKADVFYVMSGLWKTSSERFFLWIGGFRPSELLKVLVPQLNPLTEPLADSQFHEVFNLKQSCQQAEDALSQGMEKLQQNLAESLSSGYPGDGSCIPQITTAVEKLEDLVSFVSQADHLRKETLLQMSHILTIRQSALGLLAMGEYFQRLRALSSYWASQLHEPA